jgi:hypothetical protein
MLAFYFLKLLQRALVFIASVSATELPPFADTLDQILGSPPQEDLYLRSFDCFSNISDDAPDSRT